MNMFSWRLCANTSKGITGFPPGVYTGSLEVANDVAIQAEADYTAAYVQGQGLTPTSYQTGISALQDLTLVSTPALL